MGQTQRHLHVLSQRGIRQDVSRSSGFEFEDVIAALEDTSMAVPVRPASRALLHRGRRWMSQRSSRFELVPSGATRTRMPRDAALFGCFIQKPVELLELDAVPDWRQRSAMAFCVIEEMWPVAMEQFAPLVRTLNRFDLLCSAYAHVCDPLSRLTGRPVIHLPGGADVLRFMPPDPGPARVIDLYSMGRRRPALHAAIKERLGPRNAFYLYDSATQPPIAADHVLHREVLANLIRRAQLFFVDIAKIGHVDQRDRSEVWGPRYVEGMAGGAVQVGYAPDSADFAAHFDWPGAVERLPQDPQEAAAVIDALLSDPVALARRGTVNLAQALRRHDWLHRWKLVLDHFGLDPTPAFHARAAALEAAALRLDAVAGATPAPGRP